MSFSLSPPPLSLQTLIGNTWRVTGTLAWCQNATWYRIQFYLHQFSGANDYNRSQFINPAEYESKPSALHGQKYKALLQYLHGLFFIKLYSRVSSRRGTHLSRYSACLWASKTKIQAYLAIQFPFLQVFSSCCVEQIRVSVQIYVNN